MIVGVKTNIEVLPKVRLELVDVLELLQECGVLHRLQMVSNDVLLCADNRGESAHREGNDNESNHQGHYAAEARGIEPATLEVQPLVMLAHGKRRDESLELWQ